MRRSDRIRIWARGDSHYEKAWFVNDGARWHIVPKSQADYDQGGEILTVERWLADKEQIGRHTRLLVCGGRDFADEVLLWRTLEPFERAAVLIHGAARGADTLADGWARWHDTPVESYPADWETYGRAAGPRRNRQMLEQGRPYVVVAFPGGTGTANMIEQAEKTGKIVIRIAISHA